MAFLLTKYGGDQPSPKRSNRHRHSCKSATQSAVWRNAQQGQGRCPPDSAAGLFHDWLRHDHTDGPYLYELGQRSTWPDIEWDSTGGFRSPDLDYVSLSHGFHWESHLDGSLPEGFSLRVPNPWLVKALDLKADTNRPGIFRDATGDPIVISSEGDGHSYCLIRRDRLLPLMDERGLVLLWAGVGERTGWPNSDKNEGPRRRWNGLLWPIKNGYRKKIWCEDHGA